MKKLVEVANDTIWKHLRIAAYAQKGRTLFEEFGKWEILSPERLETGSTTMEKWQWYNYT